MPRTKGQQTGKVEVRGWIEVGTGADEPLAILTGTNAGACLLKFKILQELYTIGEVRVLLQASLSFSLDPFWEGSCSRRARYGVYRDGRRVGELHFAR